MYFHTQAALEIHPVVICDVLTGPTDERHRRLGREARMPAASAPEFSPCPLLRVAILLPLVMGLDNSSLGLGVSLLRARKATREEAPSLCNAYH